MTRKAPTSDTLRALFARSGNVCAFPGCHHELVDENNIFVAQVCHISAAEEGGERFERGQSDEDRRAYSNLILLCYRHHKVTDDIAAYPAERLREVKRAHEAKHSHDRFDVAEETLRQVEREIGSYWDLVRTLHATSHTAPDDIKFPIATDGDYFTLHRHALGHLDQLTAVLEKLVASDVSLMADLRALARRTSTDLSKIEALPYYERRELGNRNHDVLQYGMANMLTGLATLVHQMGLRFLEERALRLPENPEIRKQLDDARELFKELATKSILVD